MKKTTIILLLLLLGVATISARPALRGTTRISQPDGTTLSLRLVGDEWHHYNTTADGYAITRNAAGGYVYARLDDEGRLVPTTLMAHDEGQRTAAEHTFLQQTGRLQPTISPAMAQLRQQTAASRQRTLAANRANRYDYDNFKGLVLLVEYNDCEFQNDDYQEIMEAMINQDDYTGTDKTNYVDPTTHQQVVCTGSMRDYFRDNSKGIFVPTFDVVGPIKVNRSQYYTDVEKASDPDRKAMLSIQLMIDACTAADSEVDFSQYDRDGDGRVDMIYFIFAGLPSYIQGNDERLLWPHQSEMTYLRNVRKDGVLLSRYACSTELFGFQQSGWSVLEGIGTMCHEFSHVLGLPDFYDTDNNYQGLCVSPGEWSLMDHGYDDAGRCPVGYSLYERYALGFATPELISEPGSFSLEALDQSNSGYRIDTPQDREFFMIENRQPNKWDKQLPASGMLVFRVDSTNTFMWNQNSVNDNPEHPYYELVRAGGTHTYAGYYFDYPTDPFPGSNGVTRLDNLTQPANLRSWAGKNCKLGLEGIQVNDGVVSFNVFDAYVLQSIEMQKEAMVGVGMSLQLPVTRMPDYAPYSFQWKSDNEQVVSVDQQGVITGVGEGTAVVTVTANDLLTAQCTVTVRDLPVVADIASFIALDEAGEALLKLSEAQVLYAYGSDIYLRDATGSITLSGTGLKVSRNDLLTGAVYGSKTVRNRMPVLKAVSGITTATSVLTTAGSNAEPVSMPLALLDSTYYSNLVTITKAELVSDGGIYAVQGDKRYRLFNTLKVSGIKVPTDLKKRYDITAIYGTNTVAGQVIDELYLLASPTSVSYKALTALTIPEELTLPEERTYQFTPGIQPAAADHHLVWTSTNEQVATISADGLLTTHARGTALIRVVNVYNDVAAECLVTVGDRTVKADVADFKTLTPGDEAQLTLTDALVVYTYKDDAYLRDASGAIRLASTGLELKAGDVLNGNVYGRYALTAGIPELQPIAGATNADSYTVTPDQAVEPREVTISSLADTDYADLVVFREVELTQVEGLTGVYIADGDRHVRVFNTFGLKSPIQTPYEGKHFNLTGILITATVGSQTVDNLALTEKAEEVQVPDAIAAIALPDDVPVAVYTADGRLVADGITYARLRQLSLQRGIYVVKTSAATFKVVKP